MHVVFLRSTIVLINYAIVDSNNLVDIALKCRIMYNYDKINNIFNKQKDKVGQGGHLGNGCCERA